MPFLTSTSSLNQPRYPALPHAGIQAALYLIFGNTMVAFSFLLSCCFQSSKTAVIFAYLYVLATGLIGSLLLEVRRTLSSDRTIPTLSPHYPHSAYSSCLACADRAPPPLHTMTLRHFIHTCLPYCCRSSWMTTCGTARFWS